MNDELRIKYLEIIEDTIKRMADNSLKMKELFITISCAVIAGYLVTEIFKLLFIISFASIAFWIIDSCYLSNERKFRALYNETCDFSSRSTTSKLSLEYSKKDFRNSIWCCLFSWSTALLYGISLVSSMVVALLLCFGVL